MSRAIRESHEQIQSQQLNLEALAPQVMARRKQSKISESSLGSSNSRSPRDNAYLPPAAFNSLDDSSHAAALSPSATSQPYEETGLTAQLSSFVVVSDRDSQTQGWSLVPQRVSEVNVPASLQVDLASPEGVSSRASPWASPATPEGERSTRRPSTTTPRSSRKPSTPGGLATPAPPSGVKQTASYMARIGAIRESILTLPRSKSSASMAPRSPGAASKSISMKPKTERQRSMAASPIAAWKDEEEDLEKEEVVPAGLGRGLPPSPTKLPDHTPDREA